MADLVECPGCEYITIEWECRECGNQFVAPPTPKPKCPPCSCEPPAIPHGGTRVFPRRKTDQ